MNKLSAILSALFLTLGFTVSAQLSGYLSESFEPETFPPSGWTRTNVSGTNQWARSTTEHYDGVASAWMRYQSGPGEDWLISPQFSVVAGDSVTFFMLLDDVGYQPDSLSVKVSTTGTATASFTTTLLKLREGINYPPTATTWYRYAVSLNAFAGQNVYVAFKHFNNNGDGLYIDKVGIGTLPPYDAATIAINTPSVNGTQTITPSATVKNFGTVTATFNVTAAITPGGYTSTRTVTGLSQNATGTVDTFSPWTPAPGIYTLKVYTQLPGDMVTLNDTLYKTITIFPALPEYGWESSTALPGGRWAHATAFSKLCSAETDTAYLYLLSGNDALLALTTSCIRQNLATGAWSPIASIPSARQQIGAAELGGKIYVPGGYTTVFTPSNVLQIYDPATDTWTTGAPMPLAVGDYAIAPHADSLIYVIGGYDGIDDVNTVQIYNIRTNTWTTGTPKTGTANSGGRMGIANNSIVYLGGYSQGTGTTLAESYLGVINPVNPAAIAWSGLPASPMGTATRLAGGSGMNERIYFTAGDPAGTGTSALMTTAAYNTLTNTWELGPDKLTGINNTSNFTLIIARDSLYMASAGGYNGTTVSSVNEWLNIGPYTITAAAGADFSICDAGTATLSATGGTSYSWEPAASLDNALIAGPVATLSATDTFTVHIGQRYGCPVNDSTVVTLNLPVSNSQDITICFNESYAIGTNTYNQSGTYTDVLQTISGCDSTVTTSLTVLPAVSSAQSPVICFNEAFTVGSSVYSASGTYSDVLTSVLTGCDSTVTTNLTVLPANSTTQSPVICFDETFMVGSSIHASSGTYSDTLTSQLTGCDSIVVTNLTVQDFISSTQSISICPGGSFTVGTDTYTIPGQYNYTFTTVNGCDSVVTTNLAVTTPLILTVTVNGLTLTADQAADSYQWILCPSGTPVAGETGSSFTPAANGSYAAIITANGCTGETECTAVTTVGIEEQSIVAITVFPNPNDGRFAVTAAESGAFQLLNELGQVVYSFELNQENAFSTEITGMSTGVYYLSGYPGDKIVHEKIVITD